MSELAIQVAWFEYRIKSSLGGYHFSHIEAYYRYLDIMTGDK